MSPSKHQFFDITFSIYQSGGSKKESKEKKEGKKHPQRTNHIPWLLLTTIAQFHRIVSPDQHNVVGWGGVKET